MRKGFTLIELLAVIVILAVLAIIATPIVLNIIDDSKKNATLRSSENYIKAIEFSIAKSVMENRRLSDGTYQVMSNGSICIGTLSGNSCTDELVVEVSGETPESGNVTIKSRKIDSYEFTYKSGFVVVNGEIGNGETIQVCKLIGGEPNEIGSKYQCKVKDGLPSPYQEGYYFYVLSHEDDGTTNLIMERNICEDGTVATASDTCLVAWYEDDNNNNYGPVTAMTYLYNATKDWVNVPPLNYEYYDIEWQESLGAEIDDGGYESFISENGIGKMEGTKFTGEELLRARMPIYAYVDEKEYGEVADYVDENSYLYDYLEDGGYQENILSEIYGYWTLSSIASNSGLAWDVNSGGDVGSDLVYDENRDGVRPVINLKL